MPFAFEMPQPSRETRPHLCPAIASLVTSPFVESSTLEACVNSVFSSPVGSIRSAARTVHASSEPLLSCRRRCVHISVITRPGDGCRCTTPSESQSFGLSVSSHPPAGSCPLLFLVPAVQLALTLATQMAYDPCWDGESIFLRVSVFAQRSEYLFFE